MVAGISVLLRLSQDIYKKLNSYAEQQYNNEKFKNISIIEKKLTNKQDLFDRNYKYKTIKIDKSYPDFILKNIKNFKEFIYEN